MFAVLCAADPMEHWINPDSHASLFPPAGNNWHVLAFLNTDVSPTYPSSLHTETPVHQNENTTEVHVCIRVDINAISIKCSRAFAFYSALSRNSIMQLQISAYCSWQY